MSYQCESINVNIGTRDPVMPRRRSNGSEAGSTGRIAYSDVSVSQFEPRTVNSVHPRLFPYISLQNFEQLPLAASNVEGHPTTSEATSRVVEESYRWEQQRVQRTQEYMQFLTVAYHSKQQKTIKTPHRMTTLPLYWALESRNGKKPQPLVFIEPFRMPDSRRACLFKARVFEGRSF